MTITDTQVLSYYYKGVNPIPNSPILISSITAAEFLLVQSVNYSRANYYPALPTRLRHHGMDSLLIFDSKKHAARGKQRTDQLILDFNGRMPSFIEFGSIAISQIINGSHEDVYAISISHLEKSHQKKLKERLRFLIENNVKCLAVTSIIADIGMNILGKFLDKYEAKQNPRNTINDILILSTAVEHSAALITEDNLLRRFAAELFDAPCTEKHPNYLLIDFTTPEVVDRRKSFESKGYINRGWQVVECRSAR